MTSSSPARTTESASRGTWSRVKGLVRPFVLTEVRGAWDYHRHPEARDSWGGPCNGQRARQSLVREIIGAIRPTRIIETGTYRGTTTAWLREVGQVPVITIENSRWFWGYSTYRFRADSNVSVRRGDSRKVLASLTKNGRLADTPTFFYLDAHWEADLPLREELEIIFSACSRAVVMIDDFQVPGDPGYAYDDYGRGKALTLEYTRPVAERFDLAIFFPAAASAEETGARRGCVVLTKKNAEGTVLKALCGLR